MPTNCLASWLTNPQSCRAIVAAGLMLAASSCDNADPRLFVSYRPVAFPVSISCDSQGNISVTGDHRFVTPIGVFDLGATAPLSADPDCIRVILRNDQTRQDTVYKVSGLRSFDIDEPSTVEVQPRIVIVHVSSTSPNAVHFRTGSGSSSPSGSSSGFVSHQSARPVSFNSSVDLSGAWLANSGTLYDLADDGSTVRLTARGDDNIAWASGQLVRRGLGLTGTVIGTFRNDPRRVPRESRVEFQVEDDSMLVGSAEYIAWDASGNESDRTRESVSLQRVD